MNELKLVFLLWAIHVAWFPELAKLTFLGNSSQNLPLVSIDSRSYNIPKMATFPSSENNSRERKKRLILLFPKSSS